MTVAVPTTAVCLYFVLRLLVVISHPTHIQNTKQCYSCKAITATTLAVAIFNLSTSVATAFAIASTV